MSAVVRLEKGFVQLLKGVCLDASDMNSRNKMNWSRPARVGGPSAWESRDVSDKKDLSP